MNSKTTQSGATLIVALVILAIMTVLGLASIRSSNLEIKMSASQRDQSIAFQAAESALRAIEQDLAANPKPIQDHFSSCGTSANCFSSNCSGGLCFNGEFTEDTDVPCSIVDPDTPNEVTQFWQIDDNWKDEGPAQLLTVPAVAGADENATMDVKYLIEFLCLVPRDDLRGEPGEPTLPLYRITVKAQGEAKRATVNLQSTVQGRFL